jgi:hypothetical protein
VAWHWAKEPLALVSCEHQCWAYFSVDRGEAISHSHSPRPTRLLFPGLWGFQHLYTDRHGCSTWSFCKQHPGRGSGVLPTHMECGEAMATVPLLSRVPSPIPRASSPSGGTNGHHCGQIGRNLWVTGGRGRTQDQMRLSPTSPFLPSLRGVGGQCHKCPSFYPNV